MSCNGEDSCSCCSLPISSSSVYQTVEEMDFQRGIWSAAMNGDLKRVKSLIQRGIPPNLKDTAGYTALHYASRSGHLTVCDFLLESGACASPQTPGGATPLHRAAFCGHLDVARLLLRHRADPMIADGDGASALHKVCRWSCGRDGVGSRRCCTASIAPRSPGGRNKVRVWTKHSF
ncbi:ankyrin repeat domain-containing protein 39 isoform X2 [Nerophis ophidion]|uniref:ankyrin repeat domain-containing protein 39 isoform X2 n=1 Tax=Nerophis ophidion TaxID=159077 RepID=UPI002ADF9401|nr:ankyrin repeat domain-containing protein 39 isoform X2 [Nerophis ophidion]